MKHHSSLLIVMLLCLIFASCKTNKLANLNEELSTLQYLMAGTFDSAQQASQDSAYFNITLNHTPIWTDRVGYWLYVEQAVTSNLKEPYRQRIYKLSKSGDTFVSTIYAVQHPKRFVNKYTDPQFFEKFSTSLLVERVGCDVYLKKEKKSYIGQTKDDTCGSTLRGASYATSKVSIYKDKIISWDQGFDSSGNQVWGAEEGGYIFKRK